MNFKVCSLLILVLLMSQSLMAMEALRKKQADVAAVKLGQVDKPAIKRDINGGDKYAKDFSAASEKIERLREIAKLLKKPSQDQEKLRNERSALIDATGKMFQESEFLKGNYEGSYGLGMGFFFDYSTVDLQKDFQEVSK